MRTSAISASVHPAPSARPAGRPLTVTEAVVIVVIVLTAGALAVTGLPSIAVTGVMGAVTYAAHRTITGLREQSTPALPNA
ncbi:hypothetical protein [Kitasatospora griseola]|uniref:hypothetical protein n=1 Tax=Kitasatospora griseola TaxID=2064 RepID=UPI003821EB55